MTSTSIIEPEFPLTIEGLRQNKEFLRERRESGDPNYQYQGNSTKMFAERVSDLYLDREWDWVRSHAMPSPMEKQPSEGTFRNEIRTLVQEQRSWKSRSNLIKAFHPSALDASKGGSKSPNEGWRLLQSSKDEFRKFYLNRLRCSDWFNEHRRGEDVEEERWTSLLEGRVPPFIYAIGLTTSGKYPNVGMFKPHAAKYLTNQYLSKFDEVFDPFSGFSGRLLGVVSTGRRYVGRDLSPIVIAESKRLMEHVGPMFELNGVYPDYDLGVADATQPSDVKHQSLLTCSPYGNLEHWDGVPDSNLSCDDWIDICMRNHVCERYVFVTDGNIVKWRPWVKEVWQNTCHWGSNEECVVVVDGDGGKVEK